LVPVFTFTNYEITLNILVLESNRPDDDEPTARTYCLFTAERMTFSTAEARCKTYSDSNSRTCDYKNVYQGVIKPDPDEEKCSYQGMDRGIDWHWTDKSCQILVKGKFLFFTLQPVVHFSDDVFIHRLRSSLYIVAESGMIAVVHSPDLKSNDDRREIFISVHPDNTNYFKVQWDGANYPRPSNQCLGACQQVIDACLCNMQVLEESVFASVPSAEDVLDQLKIGHAHPDRYDSGSYAKFNENDSVAVYRKSGGADFDQDTLFRITHNGKQTFFKNSRSTVFITNNGGSRSDYRFRNPPHFLSFALLENRDAKYETEAVLDHYFYHPNTAPFIATRLIQRFGVSNPSPRYIKTVSKAFKTGSFESSGVTFGDGEYGNLAATIAAILLNREARNPLLDADPIGGSLKEPMLKLIAYMRAMEFEKRDVAPEIKLMDLQERIGQMPHSVPNVFSFFLPDFSPKGPIKDALLYSPEAQILVTPQIISYLNGIFSLVDVGLSDCYGGFGERTVWNCRTYYNDGVDNSDYSRGVLSYSPSSSVGSQVVDELALLLTDGRLSAASRNIMIDAYNSANNRAASLRVVQKLIVTTPEYHSTGLFTALDEIRPEIEDPIPSEREYRAVVYLYLAGGLDSYNMLVPHSNCNGGRGQYMSFLEYQSLLKSSAN
jgi:cullin-associated NEDD8-dissociated protein 1